MQDDEGTPKTIKILSISKRAFIFVGLFSFIINMLLLVSPIFMLQLYDRVLTSGSADTLIVLTGLAVFLIAILGSLEMVRSRIMVRLGVDIDKQLHVPVFMSVINRSLRADKSKSTQAIRDLDSIRQFFSGAGLFAFFDAPWTPFYLLIIFIMHPLLGSIALVAAIIIFITALIAEISSRAPTLDASEFSARANSFAETSLRNASVIKAMGMTNQIGEKWRSNHAKMISAQTKAANRMAILMGWSKAFRIMVQILILAAGGWLAINQEITPGIIIAASIISGRALAPVEQAISSWRSFVAARAARKRLAQALKLAQTSDANITLPQPKGVVKVERLVGAPAGVQKPILKGINFELEAGEILSIIGNSASGKTTLMQFLAGIWPPFSGNISIDGAETCNLHTNDRAKFIGYLPQDVELFDGNVKENIARFTDFTDQDVVKAAQAANCHELILALPQGYETQIGASGGHLSGGQRQRIALARAVFGKPALILLDEPNASLDTKGEAALALAIQNLKAENISVILVSHSVNLLKLSDKLLLLENGEMRKFGPTEAVIADMHQAAQTRLQGGDA
ncbi:MAG: type I secretion system permease/ATPase [Rhizobiales bacterium]|nr:type I secretion system permease/ATPase [Hyphomicrobiales bacterium]NRB15340.1 type I secretion system permease/ATPase [Hyphomicrobiales bacterium]